MGFVRAEISHLPHLIASHLLHGRQVFILYGSQTGNAESLAQDLSDRLAEIGVASQCMTLNAAKKAELKALAALLVIICSTTGNGDAPENADAWWRTIKLRSAVGNFLLRSLLGTSSS